MGSGLDKAREMEMDIITESRKKWFRRTLRYLKKINPDMPQKKSFEMNISYDDLRFLIDNRIKIIRNRKLIELLG